MYINTHLSICGGPNIFLGARNLEINGNLWVELVVVFTEGTRMSILYLANYQSASMLFCNNFSSVTQLN